MTNNEKELKLVQECLDDWPYAATRVVDIMIRLEKVKELLKEDELRLQEFNRNCYMSDDLPPIGGFHDDSCEEDDLYDTPIGGFHD